MLPLLQLSRVNWWRTGTYAATAGVVILFLHVWELNIDLRKAKMAYENPKVVTVYKKVLVQGPTRIITKTVEVPGRKEVVVDELRGGFSESLGGATVSEPVLPVVRTDRWLAGIGPSWKVGEVVEWNGVFGRSFSNRIDVQAEISNNRRVGARLIFRL